MGWQSSRIKSRGGFGPSARPQRPRRSRRVDRMSLVFGAYSREVLARAALRGVETGQIEAARSFGMKPAASFPKSYAATDA